MSVPKGFFEEYRITKSDSQSLLSTKDPDSLRSLLKQIFIQDFSSEKDEIVLDFYQNNLNFCISSGFSLVKTSTFLNITDYLFTTSIHSKLTNSASFELFKKLLLKHSIQRSPQSIAIFNLDDVKRITDYILKTFLRHLSLYQYTFTPQYNIYLQPVESITSELPGDKPLLSGKEINPLSIEFLEDYVEKPMEQEEELEIEEQSPEQNEDYHGDPVQGLLQHELKLLKKEMEEKIKKQDEDFLAKISKK
jgi:hypothetical protein